MWPDSLYQLCIISLALTVAPILVSALHDTWRALCHAPVSR